MTYKEYLKNTLVYHEYIKPLRKASEEELDNAPDFIKEMLIIFKDVK
tara:strand:+ start:2961 stop:3101 length:141 start_codon:yes stop_codon:yes gene_type:complete